SPRAALALIAGFSVVKGAASAVPGWTSPGIDLLWIVVQLLLLFVWLAADSRRPAWMNIGIVASAVRFLPVYLYRPGNACVHSAARCWPCSAVLPCSWPPA
ncbi:hypothetical protein, partial [Xanthomonas oryzae]